MKIGNKLMRELGFVPYSYYEAALEQMEKDSTLCAELVDQCQSQAMTIDQLSDENNELREENRELEEKLSRSGEEILRLRTFLLEMRGHVEEMLTEL